MPAGVLPLSPSPAAAAGDTLDAQLQAARERLRVIEEQREAVREQVRPVHGCPYDAYAS
jgi:hypothetical protein